MADSPATPPEFLPHMFFPFPFSPGSAPHLGLSANAKSSRGKTSIASLIAAQLAFLGRRPVTPEDR
jgi:hypothetical protein